MRSYTKRDSFLVFGSPSVGAEEADAVRDVILSGWMGTGPKAALFEEQFKAYVGRAHAVSVSSCTAAMFLGLHALNLNPGDEILTTPLTFAATVNVIEHVGARPVFVDVEPGTGLMDVAHIAAAITPQTRAILPVHLYGRACDMTGLASIADAHGIPVIEDCAHSIETTWNRRNVGTFGRLACYSFHATKNLTTVEGGMLLTDDGDLAARLKRLAFHGLSADTWTRFRDRGRGHYEVLEPGYKANMTDTQAAMGLVQLSKLEAMLARRDALWQRYDARLRDLPLVLPPPVAPGSRHARHLYTVLVDPARTALSRDRVLEELHARNIGAGVHFVGQHLQPYYRDRYGLRPDDFPEATRHSERTLSLPLSARLTEADVDDVVSALTDIFD
jgi:dTDP-4-amino-4,6-dideoxygalactose transaminase